MIVCRVCYTSDNLISLTMDLTDALPILHMLKEFTITNTEEQLPKYICEKCTNNLDIAYAFKRQYEDAIIKYMRLPPYQGETSKTDENTKYKIFSQHEDLDGEQAETVGYTLANDSNVVNDIEIEEMDVKSCTKITLESPPDVESLNADGISDNSTHEEMAGHYNTNSNGQTEWIHDDVDVIKVMDDVVKSKKENISKTENVRRLDDIQNEDQSQIALSPKSNDSVTAVDKVLSEFRELRSSSCNPKFRNELLSSAILNKIYTYRLDRYGKPYKCDVCSRYFITKGHIKTHRLRHIRREKRIQCTKCNMTFLTKPHIKNHRCNAYIH